MAKARPNLQRKRLEALEALPLRRRRFVEAYATPSSPTFGNATRSMVAAGAPDTPAARVTSTRAIADDSVKAAIASVYDAAGLTSAHLARRLRFAIDDDAPQVRASMVRGIEIAHRVRGEIGPDTSVTVDSRSIQLAAGESDALRAQLRQLAAAGPGPATDAEGHRS